MFSHFTWLHCKNRRVGFGIPHSPCITNTMRLFQSGVDEQLNISHTGHKSVDGICSYKRISEEQKKTASEILSSACTKINTKPAELDQPTRMKLSGHDQAISVTSQTNANTSLTNPTCRVIKCIMHTFLYFHWLLICHYKLPHALSSYRKWWLCYCCWMIHHS